jgi:hypothetical protein
MEFLYDECKPESHVSGQLYQLKVADLCPTQSGVGFDEVKAKVESMRHKSKDSLIALLITRPVPIVIGPGGKFYLVDHHHLARAVWELCQKKNEAGIGPENARVVVKVMCNWRVLGDFHFWKAMHENNWIYLFDPQGGGPLQPAKLPKHIKDMTNDPYRGLAWYVREHFGYDKMDADFAEFRWAQFFRTRVILDDRLLKNEIEDVDILLSEMKEEVRKEIVEAAIHLASSREAAGLPGYTGHGSHGSA